MSRAQADALLQQHGFFGSLHASDDDWQPGGLVVIRDASPDELVKKARAAKYDAHDARLLARILEGALTLLGVYELEHTEAANLGDEAEARLSLQGATTRARSSS